MRDKENAGCIGLTLGANGEENDAHDMRQAIRSSCSFTLAQAGLPVLLEAMNEGERDV